MSANHVSPQLFVSDFAFQPPDRERLEGALGSASLLLVRGQDALKQALETHLRADVVCTFFPPANLYDVAPHLRWLALASAGADYALRTGLVRPHGAVVTTAN